MKKLIIALLILITLISCKLPKFNSWYSLESGELECELNGNPTTGYQWTCKISDPLIAECTDSEYKPQSKDAKIVGSGGKWEFEIKAKSAGTTEVVFEYARSWENEPIEKRTLIIECSSKKIKSVKEK